MIRFRPIPSRERSDYDAQYHPKITMYEVFSHGERVGRVYKWDGRSWFVGVQRMWIADRHPNGNIADGPSSRGSFPASTRDRAVALLLESTGKARRKRVARDRFGRFA
jgi:hypothetical protein